MKIKQVIGFILLIGMSYGLWAKMQDGMSAFRVGDSMLVFFLVLFFGTLLFLGIRRVLRS